MFFQDLKDHLREITFKPEDFEAFLVNEVGFELAESLAPEDQQAQGFRRPILMYRRKK